MSQWRPERGPMLLEICLQLGATLQKRLSTAGLVKITRHHFRKTIMPARPGRVPE
jgi:hypothetical protein